jgi:hypothetical protein
VRGIERTERENDGPTARLDRDKKLEKVGSEKPDLSRDLARSSLKANENDLWRCTPTRTHEQQEAQDRCCPKSKCEREKQQLCGKNEIQKKTKSRSTTTKSWSGQWTDTQEKL